MWIVIVSMSMVTIMMMMTATMKDGLILRLLLHMKLVMMDDEWKRRVMTCKHLSM